MKNRTKRELVVQFLKENQGKKFSAIWQSVNRIVSVNKHFKDYIDYVSIYYNTGHIIKQNWNK